MTMSMRRIRSAGGPIAAVLLVLAALVPAAAAATQAASPAVPAAKTAAAPPPGLDALVARVLKTFDVPGLALAIVKDGRVVVANGYGIRRLGEPAPVDSHTLFGIASNSKVFTATALGLLIEEGKIAGWDVPVIDYLPGFRMSDPYVTHEMTIRDLLVHRSGLGLGAGDLLWWPPSTYNRKQIVDRLRYVPLATSFRSAYAYDNVLYLVAGEVIEAVSGRTWEDFVAERILKPVGMTDSNVRHSAAANAGNVAATHAKVDGTLRIVNPFDSDNTNPAGGINASAVDIAKWLNVILARGALPDGTRLYSERTWREITTLVTPVPNPAPFPSLAAARTTVSGYALGLSVREYRGRPMLTHTGGLAGYVSRVTTLPEDGLGVAVLTNQESENAYNSLIYSVLDHYLKAPKTDWVDAYLKFQAFAEERSAKEVRAAADERRGATEPPLPPERYAGTYRDPWYGDVAVAVEGGKLVMRFTKTPVLVGDMEPWRRDAFLVRWRERQLRADAYAAFSFNPDGSVERLLMTPASPDVDFSYDFQDLRLTPLRK